MMRTVILVLLFGAVLHGCASVAAGPAMPDSGVRFTYSDPAAASVSIAGDFNRWDPVKNPLLGPGKKGLWSITLPLAAGRYEYRFVVNGTEWVLDPTAPSAEDGMGGRNSVVTVEH